MSCQDVVVNSDHVMFLSTGPLIEYHGYLVRCESMYSGRLRKLLSED